MDLYTKRKQAAQGKISELRDKLTQVDVLNKQPGLSLFVTGSYGRGEASKHSDLDILLIQANSYQKTPISKTDHAIIQANLHEIASAMKFPPFSNDGEFLTPHSLQDILDHLGSPRDDFENHFTTRILLLLESDYVFNESSYQDCKSRIIQSYYRDYHDHRLDFVPMFLVNDIHRYWRTLCLNYEHSRNEGTKSASEKNKYHVKNLKLKFSRMLTCFSAIIPLSRKGIQANQDYVREISKSTPLERLQTFSQKVPKSKKTFDRLQKQYEWFLEITDQPKEALEDWMNDKNQRISAFDHAKEFRTAMFELLKHAVEDPDRISLIVL